jgi:hypothetical protein
MSDLTNEKFRIKYTMHQEAGLTPSPTCPPGQGGLRESGMWPFRQQSGISATVSPPRHRTERPVLVDVSAQGSASDRNCPPASTMRLTMAKRSKVERARRSIRVAVTTSPGARSFSMRNAHGGQPACRWLSREIGYLKMCAGTKPEEYLKLDVVDGVEGPSIV